MTPPRRLLWLATGGAFFVACHDATHAPADVAARDAAPDVSHDTPADGSRERRIACLISKTDFERSRGPTFDDEPKVGQVLEIFFERRLREDYADIVRMFIGLPATLPKDQPLPVHGFAKHELIEIEGDVSVGDRIDGTLVISSEPPSFEVKVAARDALRSMFSNDVALNHFVVTAKRATGIEDCR